jgi:hypothetical protein
MLGTAAMVCPILSLLRGRWGDPHLMVLWSDLTSPASNHVLQAVAAMLLLYFGHACGGFLLRHGLPCRYFLMALA